MSIICRSAFVTGAVVFSGCYLANTEQEVAPVQEGDDSAFQIDGSSSGPVPEGRGIIEDNGFKIYWEHYEVWEQGACTAIRLKNEGREVRGWEMVVDLSEDVTRWLDAGGAFMWLVDDQIFVEQEDYSDFDPWERADMFYCAEPAVLIDDVSVTFRESGDDDERSGDDSSDDDDDDVAFEGSELFTTEEGYPVLWTYETYSVADYACMNMALENRSDTPLEFVSFTAQMSNTTEFVEPEGGAPLVDRSSVLTFVMDPGAIAEPSGSVEARVCMTPLARPLALLDVVAQSSM